MSFNTSVTITAVTLALIVMGCKPNQPVDEPEQQIGASLNQKFSLPLSEVPKQALEEVLKLQPDFIPAEAEQELKHGHTYIDLEGTKADGSEVEFDMLLKDGQWQVMEMQRDLTLEQCPSIVVAALQQGAPEFAPKRIIESDQLTGVVVYEFYTVHADGSEERKEVKLENGLAELLTEEWRH